MPTIERKKGRGQVTDYKKQIEKIARSDDAKRKKQYKQMLKRLYGGNEGMVESIRESRDPNIYHGGRSSEMNSIAEKGLNAGPYREFGKGVFFGDNKTSRYYSANKLVDNNGIESIYGGFDAATASPQEVKSFIAGHPDYKFSKGERVRMARPSELKGTKQFYPNPNKSMVFDIDDRGFSSVGNHLSNQKQISWKKKKQLIEEAKGVPFQQKVDEIKDMAKNLGYDPKNRVESYKSNPDWIDADYVQDKHTVSVNNRFKPNNKKEFNQMKYYGQSREGRLFDNGIVSNKGTRNEFFIKQDNFPPELLRKENGDKLQALTVNKPNNAQSNSIKNSIDEVSSSVTNKVTGFKESINKHSLNPLNSKLSSKAKLGLGLGAGALALGAGAGIYAYNKKKKEKE